MKTEIEIKEMLKEVEDALKNTKTIPESIRVIFIETLVVKIEVLKKVLGI